MRHAEPSTLVDLLRSRALRQPDRRAYTFLVNGETEEVGLSYGELDMKARGVAALLQSQMAGGERALLLYPAGLDYLVAFFGCLYAGVVAVPTYPPGRSRRNRSLPRLQAIAADSGARAVLTTAPMLSVRRFLIDREPDLRALNWIGTDGLEDGIEHGWREPGATSETLAFLQYTSGSTGAPKGVMLSHGNLLHNERLVKIGMQHTEHTVFAGWLPLYHDMGLIGNVLQPLYLGVPCVLMSPIHFLQRPLRWLQAISRHKATTSGAPNFAYDLCVRQISPQQRATLDLSSWSVAFNGAEPIQSATLDRFVTAFEPCGFRREAFYPCYGLAEGTLIVSGGLKAAPAVIQTLQAAPLEQNLAVAVSDGDQSGRTLVGCGQSLLDQKIVIVDPKTSTQCQHGQIGEIWVSGPSVAQGYWNRPSETNETFRARVADTGEGPFLRTGDLGVFYNGELFIAGRLKDLIILRGRNYYPQDIELTVQESHPALRPECVAAFSVDVAGEERLVVVQEVRDDPHLQKRAVVWAIRQAVLEEHEVEIYAVVLIRSQSIAKTSSGKIQRHACRTAFLASTLEVVEASILDDSPSLGNADALTREVLLSTAAEQRQPLLESYLQEQLARMLKLTLPQGSRQPLNMVGLDSLMAIEFQHHIESTFGVILSMAGLLQGLSISQLASQILGALTVDSTRSAAILAPNQDQGTSYPLSHGQRALWFLYQLAPDSAAYNIARAVRIRGDVDLSALRNAFQRLVDRHSSLRTTFSTALEEPVQRIHDKADVWFRQYDASTWTEVYLNERLTDEAYQPFNLEQGPLLRIQVFVRSSEECVLLLVVHHLVADFWSLSLLVYEVKELYSAEESDTAPNLLPVPLQYTAYARWQAETLTGPEGERLRAFWQEQLSGELPVLNLPIDHPRPRLQTFRGASRFLMLDMELAARLKALSQANGVTLYVTLLAAFHVLLHRHTGNDQLIVGSPTSGRNRAQLDRVVGHFVNPVVMRADLSENPTFVAFLRQMHHTALAAMEHQDYPFDLLVERLQPERHASRSVLFQVMFVFQKAHLLHAEGLTPFALPVPGAQMALGHLTLESIALEERAAQFDLTLTMTEIDDGLAAVLAYNADLFAPATIARMLDHFQSLLESIAADPAQCVAELSVLTESERQQLLVEWNGSRPMHEPVECIDAKFEAQLEQIADAVAVVSGEEQWSYGQLNRRANQLANYLVELGVGPEVRVGICLERSFDAVAAMVGIVKAGGAYVPLDPAWPPERLDLLLADAGVEVLVTHQRLARTLAGLGLLTVCLDRESEVIAQASRQNPVRRTSPASAAYVIYTSGSSGVPKGVLVSHANLVHLFDAAERELSFGYGEVWTWFHSMGFDFSVWELWGALINRGRLVVVPYEVSRSPAAFRDLLCLQRVTVLNLTPSAFRQLPLESGRAESATALAVSRVIFGGEALDVPSVSPWLARQKEPGLELVNMYGITETTVHVTSHRLRAGDPSVAGSVIGRPLPGLQVYVLDEYLQPVPIGIAGELYVGGGGLARGYVNHPELTADRFIPHPFSSEPGARLYRSGDVGRHLPNGDIEYSCRIDQQVKVRGFRVEPAEIESVLCQHPAVLQAVVLVREDEPRTERPSADIISDRTFARDISELRRFIKKGVPPSRSTPADKRLVAYLVCDQETAPNVSALHRFVRAKLPDYMVPAFVFVKSLPLTANGKLDLRALPAVSHARPELEEPYVAPRTNVERELAEIWCDVLEVDRVGIDDNFFALGGDSIRTLRVQSIAAGRQLALGSQALFQHQTIRELAASVRNDFVESSAPSQSRPFSLISEEEYRRLPGGLEDAYPLSRLQAGLIFHSQHNSESSMYRDIFIYRIRIPFEASLFGDALQRVVDRHPVLRTAYELGRFNEPRQFVYTTVPAPLEIVDLRSMPSFQQHETLAARLATEQKRRLDWSSPPLIRFTVHRLADDTFDFILTFHSSILDGWSVASMLTELLRHYYSLLHGNVQPLEPAPVSTYRDFVALERATLESSECRQYWAAKLSDCSRLILPRLKKAAPPNDSHRIGVADVHIPPDVSADLKKLARHANVPLKHVLLAAHLWVMSRLSGHQDMLTGLESNGRLEEAEGERTLGVYLNMIPFRQELSGGRWIDLIRQTFKNEQELSRYCRFPYAELQRMHDGQPLFETAFNYTHFHVFRELERLEGLRILDSIGREQTHYTLKAEFNRDPFSDNLQLDLEFDANQIVEAQIHAIGRYYTRALTAITREPNRRYESDSLLSASEQHEWLVEWNDTETTRTASRTIHRLFEAQASRTPDSIAIVSPQGMLTYGELNAHANRLARHLRTRGVAQEALVAIYLQDSSDTIATLLAVLKAGGAFVPLDPASPRERLALMLANCRAAVLVTEARLLPGLPRNSCQTVVLDEDRYHIVRENGENLDVDATEDHLAYVMYTSGSTGSPKGVAAPHRGTLNRFQWMWDTFPFETGEVCCQKTQLGFVGCIWEMFGPLLQGVPVVMIPHDVVKDPKRFLATLAEERITRIVLVPSLLRVLMESEPDLKHGLPQLKYWLSSGEELPAALAQRFGEQMPGRVLLNIYGSTEDAADVTWHHVRDVAEASTVTIGRPIHNTAGYVLDRCFLPVPLGVPGQLHVGGVSLARGYLYLPAATAENFVPDSFGCEPGGRLYQTGDLARHLPDGTLEYLGRLDHQVKVRGMRIELEEIEAVLSKHPAVREAVVAVREDVPGDRRLVAYVALHQNQAVAIFDLKSFLEKQLPDYMVPSFFTIVDSLPRTPNWKMNRRALPVPDYTRPTLMKAFVAPRTETEALVAGIWAQVLKLDRVGVDDNLFELGGNSLLATQIIFRVCDVFKMDLHLRRLFESPTVAGLAESIETIRQSNHGLQRSPILPVTRSTHLPLSFAQQRLWFLDQLTPGNPVYSCPALVNLAGPLNEAALAQSLSEIVQRHEALRTVFPTVDGRPRQVIVPAPPLLLPTIDLTRLPSLVRAAEVQRLAMDEVKRPFDLGHDLLLRARLVKLSSEEHVVIFVTHHIVFDGWSMGVFIRELAALYEAFCSGQPSPLPRLRIQYADYAAWQSDCLREGEMESLLTYWRQQLADLPVMKLPADRARPQGPSVRGRVLSFVLPASLSRSLGTLSGREGVTLFMTVLAAFDVVLHCHAGQTDIVVGTDVANRHWGETESLIGFFSNQLVLRTNMSGNPSFRELLTRVREVALEAYARQDLPFDKLVEAVNPVRDTSRTPLFQVKLVLQNAPMPAWKLSDLTLDLQELHHGTAKFDVLLNLWDREEGLTGVLEYNTDLFESPTMLRMLAHFETVLNKVVQQPDTTLDQLREMLDEADRKQNISDRRKRQEAGLESLKQIKPKAVTVIDADRTDVSLL